jgi:hypothetical protein
MIVIGKNKMKLNKYQTKFLKDNMVPVSSVVVLTQDETQKIRKEWREKYIRPFSEKIKNTKMTLHRGECCKKNYKSNGYNWHVFSFDIVPHREVKPDYLSKKKITDETVIMIWEECDSVGIRIESNSLPKLNFNTFEDLYVFPENFRWTFVSTHENGWFGPYYTDDKIMKKAL